MASDYLFATEHVFLALSQIEKPQKLRWLAISNSNFSGPIHQHHSLLTQSKSKYPFDQWHLILEVMRNKCQLFSQIIINIYIYFLSVQMVIFMYLFWNIFFLCHVKLTKY